MESPPKAAPKQISNRNLLWLAGLGWLAGCWLAGAGRLGLSGWLFVFGRLVGWFVGLSAGYLVCGLACTKFESCGTCQLWLDFLQSSMSLAEEYS